MSIPFEDLAGCISGEVFTPNHTEYDSHRKHWNTFADRPRPSAVVCPKSTSDVQSTALFARQYGIAVVVKGGGHSYRSSQDNALVIDMKHFKEISLDEKTGITKVGGGVLLGELDAKIAPWHVPVGIFHSTGAVGLIIHGGLGFLSRTKGFSVDNILGAKVVMADGTVLICNKDKNPDLLWGMKGAGSSFGVVVEVIMQAHLIKESWAAMLAWPSTIDSLNKVLDWADSITDDRMTVYILLSHTPDSNKLKVISAACIFIGPAEDANKMVEPLMATNPIPIIPGTAMPFVAIQQISKDLAPDAYWYLTTGAVGGKTIPSEMRQALIDRFNDLPTNMLGCFALEMRGGVASKNHVTSCCAPSDRNHVWDWVIMLGTTSEEKESELTEITRKARDQLRSLSSLKMGIPASNTNHKFHFNPEGVFGENFPRLKEIKNKYDPTNFFKGLIDLTN